MQRLLHRTASRKACSTKVPCSQGLSTDTRAALRIRCARSIEKHAQTHRRRGWANVTCICRLRRRLVIGGVKVLRGEAARDKPVGPISGCRWHACRFTPHCARADHLAEKWTPTWLTLVPRRRQLGDLFEGGKPQWLRCTWCRTSVRPPRCRLVAASITRAISRHHRQPVWREQ